jgi:hypothetical protein
LKVAGIFRTRLRRNRTSTAMARRILEAATGRRWAIVRMAEDAVGVRGAVGAIEDAAGAVDVLAVAAADGIVADAAGLAGGDTRSFLPRIFTDKTKGHDSRRGLFAATIAR